MFCIDDWNIDYRRWSKKILSLERPTLKKITCFTAPTIGDNWYQLFYWYYPTFWPTLFKIRGKGENMGSNVKNNILTIKCGAKILLAGQNQRTHAFPWWKTTKNAFKLSLFCMSRTWASCTHDEKSLVLIILKRFQLFSTMQVNAQACVCWSKNTTNTWW